MPQETVASHSETFTQAESKTGVMESASEEQAIDFLEVLTVLLRERNVILKFMFVLVTVTTILVCFVMKPTYTAKAVFLPPQNAPGSGLSQIASQLGSLGAMGALGGLKNSGDTYLGILGSRTIADGLIKKFNLQSVYKSKRLSDAEKDLKKQSTFVLGKDTLITISVDDHDAQRSADLANGYLDALREQNGRLALTESAQRRLFFEQQLLREKDALADAEVELKKTEEQTGLIAPNGQAQMEIETMAQVRAQITSRQVELDSLKQSATDQNPAVVRLQTEIAGLEQQLQKFQNDSGRLQPGNVQVPTARVPELALEYIRKQREVKYHEVLFELLAKQYESARLDESRDAPVLQIVDRALVPDKKSGPRRVLLIVCSALLGALLGMVWVFLRHTIAKLQQDPFTAKRLEALREAALLRR
jgi:tyrosine-protein kinase Etk/Wzc